jgi:NAD(P)-dependent dehydrogenase (short-subunit alcohol dehydrogenase family)
MSELKIAVVTGGNRGLGLETCRQLAARGLRVVLTARDQNQGAQAAAELMRNGLEVRFHPLEVTDEQSIQALAAWLKETFGRIDVLVNNAGIFPDPFPGRESGGSVFAARLDKVRLGFETNTLGPLRLCQVLIPLMKGYGRVVNVSSGMGQLSEMNGCCPAYRLSKTALNAVTRIFHDELQDTGIKVNSVCPGWVRTDMGGAEAERDLETGAASIVWAATLEDDGPSGGFFRDGQPIPW